VDGFVIEITSIAKIKDRGSDVQNKQRSVKFDRYRAANLSRFRIPAG